MNDGVEMIDFDTLLLPIRKKCTWVHTFCYNESSVSLIALYAVQHNENEKCTSPANERWAKANGQTNNVMLR